MTGDYSPRDPEAISVYINYTRRDGMPTYAEAYLLESGRDAGRLLVYSARRTDDPMPIGGALAPADLAIYGTDVRITAMTLAAYERRHLLTAAGFEVRDQAPELP